MKASLRRLHRYVAFALAVLWLSQALTGLLMVYRWELDDALLPGDAVPLDAAALGASIAAIEGSGQGQKVTQLWATGGADGRFDLYVDDAAGQTQILRVDGIGRVLRNRDDGAGLIPKAATLHQTLFAGQAGKWIVGASGTFLIASMVMGAVLAWPKRVAQWSAVLVPRAPRPGAARRYAWHRAAGLWLAAPAVVLAGAGVLMTVQGPLEGWLGLDETPPELAAVPAAATAIGPGRALATALQRVPGSDLSGAALPTDDRPWYRIRVRQPEEWRRVYGTTVVYVAAADGRVLRVEDALAAPRARAFMDNLYPVHTGEAAGWAGRLLTLAIGGWLLVMLVLGFGLWFARRR